MCQDSFDVGKQLASLFLLQFGFHFMGILACMVTLQRLQRQSILLYTVFLIALPAA